MNSDNRDEPLWAQFPPSFLGANNFFRRPFRTDKTRWMEAFKPPAAEQEGETVYASWGKDSVMNWILNILWEEYTYNIACITGASWAKRGEWALRVQRNTGGKKKRTKDSRLILQSRIYIFLLPKFQKPGTAFLLQGPTWLYVRPWRRKSVPSEIFVTKKCILPTVTSALLLLFYILIFSG